MILLSIFFILFFHEVLLGIEVPHLAIQQADTAHISVNLRAGNYKDEITEFRVFIREDFKPYELVEVYSPYDDNNIVIIKKYSGARLGPKTYDIYATAKGADGSIKNSNTETVTLTGSYEVASNNELSMKDSIALYNRIVYPGDPNLVVLILRNKDKKFIESGGFWIYMNVTNSCDVDENGYCQKWAKNRENYVTGPLSKSNGPSILKS